MRRNLCVIWRRECYGFFTTPMMALLLWAALVLAMGLPLYFGGFFERDQADLQSFFNFLPWIMLVLTPAVGMRAWADEYKSGTIETICTMPPAVGYWVAAKFLAAWTIMSVILLASFPMVIMVGYLGNPDYGPVFGGYAAAILLSGVFLAVSQWASALAKQHVVAFVLGLAVCFALLMSGSPLLTGLLGGSMGMSGLADFLLSISLQYYYDRMTAGDLALPAMLIPLFLMVMFLILANGHLRNARGRA